MECVVRGYLAGSGWKEYQESQSVCGIKLPSGLKLASQLPEPIFTPSTKAEQGHDENIDMQRCAQILGDEIANRVKTLSLGIYSRGREYAAQKGIIVADTKFEFGTIDEELFLIDECLTPDSSRFWPRDEYAVGQSPPSFDKQFVRDYLETLDWDKTPPAPKLPDDVVKKTSEKYREAFSRLTGRELQQL
jgi:phosphoribosylaminoimidazole-succinocarboxamide synthase